MPPKRDVLEQLKRDELLAAADRFELEIRDRRVRDEIVEALAGSRKAGLAEILEELPRKRLKEICRALDLDDSGREKAILIARLTGKPGDSKPEPVAAPAPPAKTADAAPPASGRPRGRAGAKKPSKAASSANLGFEDKLWTAADKLRGHMDASEYKNVVLGLIFLSTSTSRTPSKSSARPWSATPSPIPKSAMNTSPSTSSGSPRRPAGPARTAFRPWPGTLASATPSTRP